MADEKKRGVYQMKTPVVRASADVARQPAAVEGKLVQIERQFMDGSLRQRSCSAGDLATFVARGYKLVKAARAEKTGEQSEQAAPDPAADAQTE